MKSNQELDERKMKILQTIIKTYLETGEPVGSRTISKYADLNLSSATIRNEMADLEDLGYIIQPHTSAGRIPSDKGYRWYVDTLMEEKEQEVTEIKEQMLQKADKMDQLLKQAAKVLAANTNYATMISAPTYNRNKLKFIQLSQVDENQIIAVIVMEGNIIKNKIVTVGENLGNETLLKLNMLLNTNLNGMSIEEINLGMIARLKEQAGIHSEVISDVLDAVAKMCIRDRSMVLKVQYKEFDLLLTGDVEGKGEEILTKNKSVGKIDVLKVAHHGSKNSTTKEFLDLAKPKVALISAGQKNSYGHPHKETLKRLQEYGVRIYNTQEAGAVTIETDGKRMRIEEYIP